MQLNFKYVLGLINDWWNGITVLYFSQVCVNDKGMLDGGCGSSSDNTDMFSNGSTIRIYYILYILLAIQEENLHYSYLAN